MTSGHSDARDAERELLRSSLRRLLQEQVQACGGIAAAAEQWPRVWTAARELGIAALGADESLGGVQELCAAMEESGYAGAPVPLLPTVLINRLLAPLAGSTSLIEGLQNGTIVACFSFAGFDGDPQAGSLRYEDGRASGRLRLVEFADGATHLAAFAAAGQLLLVDLRGSTARVSAQSGLARPSLCDIVLEVAVADVFSIDTNASAAAHDIARLALAARALGAATRAFKLAVEHAKTRKQFGQPIGRFQAVQHKLADCLIRLDSVRLGLASAAASCDAASADRPFFAAAVFAFANPALRQTMLEVQHVFGAIGYSEEHDSPQHFRRVHADLLRLGGVRQAREDVADWLLQGQAYSPRALPPHELSPEADALKLKLHAWLAEHWGPQQRAKVEKLPGGDHGWSQAFSAAMARDGWIGLSWPRAYGGSERSVLEQFALIQELGRAGAPNSLHIAGELLIAPAIMAFGTTAQKERFLPAILRGELSVCLGYSEPEAGSDLASLRTRAVRDGDDWLISGQKLWTTGMEHAQYIWLAARTDPEAQPQHAGISIFMVPLDTPGVTRRPSMAFYGMPFTTTFWDEVRVSNSALIGEVNGGWKVITHALAAERLVMGGNVARIEALFARLCAHVAADPALRERADVRGKIGELAAEVEAARQLVLRTVRMMAAGRMPLHEAAMCKAYSGELMERLSEAALDLVGGTALLSHGADGAPCEGGIEQMLRTSIMMVIGGGTNEIQRNLIAQRGIGLPR